MDFLLALSSHGARMSGRRAVGGCTKRACVDLLQKAGFGAKPEQGSPAASTSSTHAQTFLPATPVLLRGTTFSVYSSEWSWATRTQRSWTARHLGLRPKGACDMYDEERCRDHAREKMSEGRITGDRSSPASPPPTSLRISRSQPLDPLLCQYGRLSADRPGVMAEHYEQENEQQNKTWQDMSREWRFLVCGVVGANCVVFLMWQATSIRRFMAKNFAISSAGVLKEGRLHTLITSIFSHYDAVHLGANMACLVIFGKSLMPILGRSRFLALYLGAGIASSLAQVAWPVVAPDHLRYSPYQLGLGASGASNAVVVFNMLTFPGRIVMVMMMVPVPALLPGLLFIAKDAVGIITGDASYLNEAHIAGTAWGCAFWLLMRATRLRAPMASNICNIKT